MPLKDPVKRKEYYDAFRKTEHAIKYQHEWYMNSGRREAYASATEEEKKERSKKRSIANQTPEKRMKMKHYDWRRSGIKFYDKEAFTKLYLETTHCQLCPAELTEEGRYNSPNKKVVDHDHLSGYWRAICCHTCNTKTKPRDMGILKVHLELHRLFNIKGRL